jgi:hypothetical protein
MAELLELLDSARDTLFDGGDDLHGILFVPSADIKARIRRGNSWRWDTELSHTLTGGRSV